MKKITCLIILFISLFVVTSCSKDENVIDNKPNDTSNDNSSNNNTNNNEDDGVICVPPTVYRPGNIAGGYRFYAELDDNYDKDDECFNFVACVDIFGKPNSNDMNKYSIYAENSESLGFEEELKIDSGNFEIVSEWKDKNYSDIVLPDSDYGSEDYLAIDCIFKVSVPRQLFKGNPNENSFIRLGIIEKQDDEYKQKSQITFVYQKNENGLFKKSEMVCYEDEVLEAESVLDYNLNLEFNYRKEGVREVDQDFYTSICSIIDNDDIKEYNVSEFDEENNLFNIPVYYKKSKEAPLKDIDGYAIGVENLYGDNNVEGYEKVGNSYILDEFDSFANDLKSEYLSYYKGYYTLPVEIIETNIDKCFFKQILYAIVDGEYYVVDYVYYESIADNYYFVADENTLYIGYSLIPIWYYDYCDKDVYNRIDKWMEEYNNADEVIRFFGY